MICVLIKFPFSLKILRLGYRVPYEMKSVFNFYSVTIFL